MAAVEEESKLLVREHGLTLVIAGLFLSGEMAGSGVLALPYALVGTGPAGLALILFFGITAAFVGTRLGICWIIMEERYPEFRGQVRDPYPTIAEKAGGRIARAIASFCITVTLYGTGCVYIVVMANFIDNLANEAGLDLSVCLWMLIVAAGITPLCWLGTPNDFWPVAVGALISTIAGCVMVMTKATMDVDEPTSCYNDRFNGTDTFTPVFPSPTAQGFFKAFGSIMFAFSGASTFPTIQSDMKDRRQFPKSAVLAVSILLSIYLPVATVGYFQLGEEFVENNIVESVCSGTVKIIIEVVLLLHLIAAFPIMINPPNQYFEELLKIPKNFNWKRCVFRALVVGILLFISETLPNFGSILDLVGASTVTTLTFIFPPFFYMRLVAMSAQNPAWQQRFLPWYEKAYCIFVIAVGVLGGGAATVNAFINIISNDFTSPCYIAEPDSGSISE